jgi:hypothetical protein
MSRIDASFEPRVLPVSEEWTLSIAELARDLTA